MNITVNDSKEGTVATWTVESVEKMGDNTVLLGCTNGKKFENQRAAGFEDRHGCVVGASPEVKLLPNC